MEKAYVLTGELRDGRSLVLDEGVPLAAELMNQANQRANTRKSV